MARLSRTFLLVGGIIGLVLVGVLLLCSAPFFVFSAPFFKEYIVQGLESGASQSSFPGTPEEQATAIQIMLLCFGICSAVWIIPSVLCSLFSFKARKNPTKGALIVSIVFGSIVTGFTVAGGILGLIAKARQERNDRRNNIVDAQ